MNLTLDQLHLRNFSLVLELHLGVCLDISTKNGKSRLLSQYTMMRGTSSKGKRKEGQKFEIHDFSFGESESSWVMTSLYLMWLHDSADDVCLWHHSVVFQGIVLQVGHKFSFKIPGAAEEGSADLIAIFQSNVVWKLQWKPWLFILFYFFFPAGRGIRHKFSRRLAYVKATNKINSFMSYNVACCPKQITWAPIEIEGHQLVCNQFIKGSTTKRVPLCQLEVVATTGRQ